MPEPHFIRVTPRPVSVAGLGRFHIATCSCKWTQRRQKADDLNEDIRIHREHEAHRLAEALEVAP